MRRSQWSPGLLFGTLAAALLAALCVLAVAAARLWTELLWYRSLGQESVFETRIVSQAAVWAACSLVAFLAFYASSAFAQRAVDGSRRLPAVNTVGALALALLSGWAMAEQWPTFRLALARVPFGLPDPQFGLDVGFFVFTLPVLETLASWVTGLVMLSIILVLVVVFAPALNDMTTGNRLDVGRARALLSPLLGLLFLAVALNYRIAIWRLDLSSRSLVAGASYTDVHAQLPAYVILMGLAVVVGLVLIATARSQSWKPAVASVGVWLAVAVLVGAAWPSLVQNYIVAPNEARLEAPYIERNIDMTRRGFQLASISSIEYPATDELDDAAASRAQELLAETRIWTPASVRQAYDQLQAIRPYYALSPIVSERYQIDGRARPVLVAAREMDTSKLPKKARTWVNQHLVYTHGYGLAIASSAATTPLGFPEFLVGGVPPKVADDAANAPSLATTQPRIYFGTHGDDYAIVNTGIEEFDYPLGDKNVTCTYDAEGGIRAGSLLQRVAWAIRLGSDQIIFSDYLGPDSRVLMYRDVRSAASRLAPWLHYEADPYPALVDGRIVWILDAYTSSDHYPYSQPFDGVNYVRDSVKVTVDALTGDMRLYAIGEDPIRDAWGSIFPGLITPESRVPASLAAHFRYPPGLFATQLDVYRTYHMTDPMVFYNKEDQWQRANATRDTQFRAAYLMVETPDSEHGEGFFLVAPYAPANRSSLIALLAAGCDPDRYGQHTAYLMPKDRTVLGPEQVSARITQDPAISPQLALWDQRGSDVVLGEMVLLPVEGSMAQVQPVYLKADDDSISALAAVVVVSGEKVEMGDTLGGALERVFGSSANLHQ